MLEKIKLGEKYVGDGFPCFTIAEIGGLFQNFEEAKRLIDSAIEIGIDGIKFQTLEADTITTKNNYFDMKATGKISQYEVFKQYEPAKELQTHLQISVKISSYPITDCIDAAYNTLCRD